MKLTPYSFLHFALGLLFGILSAVLISIWLPIEALVLISLFSLTLLKRGYFFMGASFLGYCWLLVFLAWQIHQAPLTNHPSSHNTLIKGVITQTYPNTIRVGNTRLNWYIPRTSSQQALPRQGELWQLEARIRPLRSLQNFGQTDSTGNKLAAGQLVGGYIARDAKVIKIKEASRVNQWRNQLINQIDSYSADSQRGWRFLFALGLGAKTLLTADDWQLLQRTGTLHLWVVSGLHLGLLAGLVLGLARFFSWRQGIAFPLAAAAALGYAQLAGWGLAAERSALMLLLGLLILSGWRKLGTWLAVSLALIILLLVNPLIVLSKGFWLSFGAVVILIAGFYGRAISHPVISLIKVQVLLLLAFTPLLLWQGGWFNPWSLPINLLLVPLVGLLLLPITLLALALSTVDFYWPLEMCAIAFNYLVKGLAYAAQLEQPLIQQASYLWLGLLILLPSGIPLRHFSWLGLLLAFLPHTLNNEPLLNKPLINKPHNWQVKVLDVGQGTAVLIESAGEKLLYDTGKGFSSGWAAVVPALTPWLTPKAAPKGINQLIISHDDQDHVGGLTAIKKRWAIQQEYSAQQHNCYAGQIWQLGQLEITALWPPQPPLTVYKKRANNSDSCVLLIKAPEHNGRITSVLLTGDAGLAEEAFFSQVLPQLLTNQQGEQQPLTLLITGHHGSQTSTGLPLLQATQPLWAVHTNGWRNSYGHPHNSVVQRLRQLNVTQLSTAAHGAVHFDMGKITRMHYKNQKLPLWHGLGYR
ncbi:MAG TPA: DNA internalization-related competence protein ComEC/Rec2 [Marinospirillum sp.]|uniref:DNA internalization-related competence protein ComEC/Rec2 n=1 Tax=Marinospirillum sp. TaxID=2183934 RepID=UPI002B4A2AD9|nr:DNA internalization-related competence protein ComEC/Rec2 [Marinospirillum sp.]HKM15804.1 DNA internalization-related competence protein ComEC/Rec2 [Marinospirillum sp.]